MSNIKELIDKLYKTNYLNSDEILELLNFIDKDNMNYLMEKALETKMEY